MTPKTNKNTKSASARKSESKSSSSLIDSKKQNDPRLNSILQLIETQLPPIQEVIIYYAKSILDKTRALKSRQTTLAKFRKIIPDNSNTNDTSTPSSPSFYIPKSARVNIKLTYSNALKDETEIKDLEEELKESIKIFGARVACIFERTARLEETQEKTSRLHTFLTYCHKLIQGFVIIARQTKFTLETNLNTENLELWTMLVLLRNFKNTTVLGLKVYEQYLEVNYQDVKSNFTKMFLPGYLPPENDSEAENDIFFRRGTEDEQKFICAVVEQVEGLIIPTTFKLQLELDKKEEKQVITSMIAAKFKRSEILTATEATALAIHEISPTNQDNMEQHIKKLIDEAINKKLKKTATSPLPSTSVPTSTSTPTPPSQRKRKNFQGGKKPRPSPPKNKRGETTTSFRYHVSDNDNNEKQPIQNTKRQKRPNQEQQQNTPKRSNASKNKHQAKTKNGRETQEERRRDTRKEN
jgi:hypothetical protein